MNLKRVAPLFIISFFISSLLFAEPIFKRSGLDIPTKKDPAKEEVEEESSAEPVAPIGVKNIDEDGQRKNETQVFVGSGYAYVTGGA
ncbi:hypothetical protein ACFLRA_02080 [Bdellovibrionota bacterium]